MLRVHQESGVTGNFRLYRGKLQCEVRVSVSAEGSVLEIYRTWRAARDADCVLASVMSEGVEHERAIA